MPNSAQYFLKSFNAVKVCNDAGPEGCDPSAIEPLAPGVVLANGVIISDIDGVNAAWAASYAGQGAFNVEVDLNGTQGPNVQGNDRLALTCNVGIITLNSGTGTHIYDGLLPGACRPTGTTAANALYNRLMQ